MPASTKEALGSRENPYTHVLYRSVEAPPGYEGWECFSIPVGGTSFGAILVAGPSTSTRYDISSAVVFVAGVDNPPEIVDLSLPPADWNNVEVVAPNTVACSHR